MLGYAAEAFYGDSSDCILVFRSCIVLLKKISRQEVDHAHRTLARGLMPGLYSVGT